MIKINNKIIELNRFPDNSFHFTPNVFPENATLFQQIFSEESFITWNYEGPEELTAIIYLTNYLRDNGVKHITLLMPYIPNARQDRIKSNKDVFTLKYFCNTINWLNFDKVIVFDPHSHVSEALLNNLTIVTPERLFKVIMSSLKKQFPDSFDNMVIYYPDEGAMKRYSDMLHIPYVFGIKHRDWETGKITHVEVAGNINNLKGKDILMIDDICSRGGTFYYGAKALKDLGVNDILLYISHCESTIFKGELLDSGLIDTIWTTDSIFNCDFEKPEYSKYKDKFAITKIFEEFTKTTTPLTDLGNLFGGIF